jgi:hypothetical protein
MSSPKIMIIRHAEKPVSGVQGYDPDGNPDNDSLSQTGWERAGALAAYFAFAGGKNAVNDPEITVPHFIFASHYKPRNSFDTEEFIALPSDPDAFESMKGGFGNGKDEGSHSKRPQETVSYVVEKLQQLSKPLTVNFDYNIGEDEEVLANAAKACDGPVLICWEHHDIEVIAGYILGTAFTTKWDGTRFDMVWVFDYDTNSNSYSFKISYQMLLHGDTGH